MTLELNKIKRSMHMEVLQSFKDMLDHMQEAAECTLNHELMAKVDRYIGQWNRITGDSRQSPWVKWEAEQGKQLASSTFDCD
jgi:hypothetical protein